MYKFCFNLYLKKGRVKAFPFFACIIFIKNLLITSCNLQKSKDAEPGGCKSRFSKFAPKRLKSDNLVQRLQLGIRNKSPVSAYFCANISKKYAQYQRVKSELYIYIHQCCNLLESSVFLLALNSKSRLCLVAIILFLCFDAQSATYKIHKNTRLFGEAGSYTIAENDTFYDIARKFDLGIVELMAANPGVDPWIPEVGSSILLPTTYIIPEVKRQGIVINLPELRLFYFSDAQTIMTFPIGIGRDGWQTPVGETKIILKRKNPSWTPPDSILEIKPDLPKIVPAGPDNPLGLYAMTLGFKPGAFLIHGTNKPAGIGLRSSHGCIRMYPEDIEVLFSHVKKGTNVRVIDSPYQLGWKGAELYLKVMPTQEQSDEIANNAELTPLVPENIYKYIDKMNINNIKVDWPAVDEAIIKRTGITAPIGKK
jgi:L,D-transpeptidase ErfK/SrfK